jgi:membrane fusion protein (multidrug efflux system)
MRFSRRTLSIATTVVILSGALTDVYVREGDRARRGQLIARIDPGRYAFELGKAKAALERAKVQFAELTLFDEEIADPERRRMARAKSGLDEAEMNLRRPSVRAPFDGWVANLAVVRGQPRDSIAEVVDLSRIKIEVQVLETELPYLEEEREARVSLSAFADTVLVGPVASINPVVDPRTRTAR